MTSMPQNIKPLIWGAVVGSVLTMIVGFSYGGWTTSGVVRFNSEFPFLPVLTDANGLNATTTHTVRPDVNISQSKADRAVMKKMGELKALTSSYDQRDFVTKTGWATVPGNENPNSDVAQACADALLKTASK